MRKLFQHGRCPLLIRFEVRLEEGGRQLLSKAIDLCAAQGSQQRKFTRLPQQRPGGAGHLITARPGGQLRPPLLFTALKLPLGPFQHLKNQFFF